MVTIFICSTELRTKGMWKFQENASRADIRMVELVHRSLRKIISYCSDRVPIYVHTCFYE